LLSGGYDSSALAVQLQRIGYPTETFSIGFDGWPESEHRYAEEVAERCGMEHRSWVIGRESLALASRLAEVYDEPLADTSIVPTFAASFLASRHVKAVLSGEGGDELLGGYTWQHDRARREAAGETIDPVEHYAAAMAMGSFDRARLAELFDPALHESLPEDPLWFYRRHLRPELAPVAQVQHLDLRTFLGELVLTKVDRATMACSLEARVPFLDRALVEELWTLAPEVRFQAGVQKPLLRPCLEGRVPARILERKKQGFVGPDSFYADVDWYRRVLEGGRLVADGVLRAPAVEALLAAGDVWRLWKVAVLELWYRRWGPER
jgi:asparagine synthase (glutamine-hydrolysing)